MCRSRRELSNECVCTLLLRSLVQIFIFQFLSMSLFLNLLFETDSYSNEYLHVLIVFTIYLQNLASIQPKTSSLKFAEARKRYPTPVMNLALPLVRQGLSEARKCWPVFGCLGTDHGKATFISQHFPTQTESFPRVFIGR